MLKVGSKRRRTKNEIKEEKDLEAERRVQIEADMRELANLRSKVKDAEIRAANNAGAAQLMSHMVNAGQIRQVGEQEIILNAVGGVQRFGVQEGL